MTDMTDTTDTYETDTATGSAPGSASEAADELGARLSTIEGFPALGAAGEDPDALVRAVKQAIAHVSQCQARLLALLDEVDRTGIWEGWIGIRSLAHWVSFVCEVRIHTAREYLRVMRALRHLPEVASLFAVGRVSYSKVRAITRIADRIDPQRAAEIVVLATAEQLSKMVSTYSLLVKRNERDELVPSDKDRFTVVPDGAGRARLIIDLPETEALLELIRAGKDATGGTQADAARATMVVHVSPDTLAQAQGQALDQACGQAGGQLQGQADVPAGTCGNSGSSLAASGSPGVPAGTPGAGDVPAGTPRAEQKAYVDEYGAISPESAARLACTSAIIGAAVDRFGDVLALGRTKRLASSRQRLALNVRDVGLCQFPGCGRRRRLEAHHRQPWSEGGPTDLDNLILLCRSHHIAVHEHRLRIEPSGAPYSGAREGSSGFVFLTEDGRDVARFETHLLAAPPEQECAGEWKPNVFPPADLDDVSAVMTEPLKLSACAPERLYGPERISTFGGGYGFSLSECVAWLFDAEKPREDLGLAA